MPRPAETVRFAIKDGERMVTHGQISKALEEFDEKKRGKVADAHKGWFILQNGQRYPPKWVLKLATGLNLDEFKSVEARKTLNGLGFDLREEEAAADDVDDADEVDPTFRIERDLQAALRKKNNIEQIEPRLKIIDGGKEQIVESGRIDITAEDNDGVTVVIELKAVKAGRRAIGQILAYMGDLSDGKKQIRGILVAEDFSPQAVAAARIVPNLQLKKYNFKFVFETARTR